MTVSGVKSLLLLSTRICGIPQSSRVMVTFCAWTYQEASPWRRTCQQRSCGAEQQRQTRLKARTNFFMAQEDATNLVPG
jgi:hypothetical protein